MVGNLLWNIPRLYNRLTGFAEIFFFDPWASNSIAVLPSLLVRNAQFSINGPDTLTAHFVQHTVKIDEADPLPTAVYPTIFSKDIIVEYGTPGRKEILLTMYSSIGHEVFSETKNLSKGRNRIGINLPGQLPFGIIFSEHL